MTQPFQVLMLEGEFAQAPEGITARNGAEVVLLSEALAPFVGQRVRLAFHQSFPRAPQPSIPGFGSCLTSDCAFHRLRPDLLLNVSVEGVLVENAGTYSITGFDGQVKPLPFEFLAGHYGRVAAASLLDVERMREAVLASENPEALAVQAASLRDVVEQIKQKTKGAL